MGTGVNQNLQMDLSEPSPASKQAPNTNRAKEKNPQTINVLKPEWDRKKGNIWNKSPSSPLFSFSVSGLLSQQKALRPACKQTPFCVAWSQGKTFLFRCETVPAAVLGTSIPWMHKPADPRIMELLQLEKTFKIIQCNPLTHHWHLPFPSIRIPLFHLMFLQPVGNSTHNFQTLWRHHFFLLVLNFPPDGWRILLGEITNHCHISPKLEVFSLFISFPCG